MTVDKWNRSGDIVEAMEEDADELFIESGGYESYGAGYAVFNANKEEHGFLTSYDERKTCEAFIAGYKAAIARLEELL